MIADVVGYYSTVAGGASYFPAGAGAVPIRAWEWCAAFPCVGCGRAVGFVVMGRGGGAGEWGDAVVLNVTSHESDGAGVS